MARRGLQVALLIGGLALLGAMAWGVGWIAHSLVDRSAAPAPAATAGLTTLTATAEPLPATATLPPPTIPVQATATLRPTSTLRPTPVLTPTPEVEVVQRGEGLYDVCRRHCPGRWPAGRVTPELDDYARQVAWENGLRWGRQGPRLYEGQVLRMPPCPP